MTDITALALAKEEIQLKQAEEVRNTIIANLMKIRFHYLQPHYFNVFHLDFDKTQIIAERIDHESFTIPGYLESNNLKLKLSVVITFKEIKFNFDHIQYSHNILTRFYLTPPSSFDEFVSKMVLDINRKVFQIKIEQLSKTANMFTQPNCDYPNAIKEVQNNFWLDEETKMNFYKEYSHKAQVQTLKKELAAKQREYSKLHVDQFSKEYEKMFEQWKKDMDLWTFEFEKDNFTPIKLFRLTYLPKEIHLDTIRDDDGETQLDYSELYISCEVTSDQPDKNGYYTKRDGNKIKILGQLVSITMQDIIRPVSTYCHSLKVHDNMPGYGYKTYIYVNPKDKEKIEKKLASADIPRIPTRDEFLLSKGCVKNGTEWVFNG